MMKQGQIVALDTTQNLLARVSQEGHQAADLEKVFMQVMAGVHHE